MLKEKLLSYYIYEIKLNHEKAEYEVYHVASGSVIMGYKMYNETRNACELLNVAHDKLVYGRG